MPRKRRFHDSRRPVPSTQPQPADTKPGDPPKEQHPPVVDTRVAGAGSEATDRAGTHDVR